MKKLSIFLLTVAVLTCGCTKSDLDDIRSRLTKLEAWQTEVNSSISSLQQLVTALEGKDYVTSVTPLVDGTGYVINFQNSGAVTIKNGEKGATPIIGTRQDTDNKYYWTVNGEWLLNNGAKIPTTGDKGDPGAAGVNATAPQVRINATSGEWEVSVNGGTDWTSTGVKAQGDAIFAKNGIDNTNDSYVELTLADGTTKIQLPRYHAFKIGTDSGNEALTVILSKTIPLSLPTGFKASNYTAIMAQVISKQGTGSSIETRAATEPWSVSIHKPTFDFTNGVYNNDASVTVYVPGQTAADEKALVEVTIVGSDGTKTVATRALTTKTASHYNDAGSGTEADPWLIDNERQLRELATKVNNNEFAARSGHFKLISNIRLSYEWVPIGAGQNSFLGTFDGNGKTISNLYWNNPSDSKTAVGFFGDLSYATVKYLTVEGNGFEGGETCGGIAGNANGSKIIGCTVRLKTIEACLTEGCVSKAGGITAIGGTITVGCICKCEKIGATNFSGGIVALCNQDCGVYACMSACSHSTKDIFGYIVAMNTEGFVQNCCAIAPTKAELVAITVSGVGRGYSSSNTAVQDISGLNNMVDDLNASFNDKYKDSEYKYAAGISTIQMPYLVKK